MFSLLKSSCGTKKKKYATVGAGNYNGHKQSTTTSTSSRGPNTKDTFMEDDAMVISSHETCI